VCGRRGERVGTKRACARPTWLSRIATTPALTHRLHPCSCAPLSPLLTRWLCPCSRTHPSSSALMQPPPLLADGKRRTPAAPLRVSHLCSLPRSGCRPCSFLCVWLLLTAPSPYSRRGRCCYQEGRRSPLYAHLPLIVPFILTLSISDCYFIITCVYNIYCKLLNQYGVTSPHDLCS
jgi:hypothetical protein